MNLDENSVRAEEKGMVQIVSETNDGSDLNKASSRQYFFQIDVMKFLCIFMIVSGHTNGGIALPFEFWSYINPVTLFIIIMGFNQGHSFKRQNLHTLRELYSYQYFKKIFWRFLFPIILINIFCVLFDLLIYNMTSVHISGWSLEQWNFVSWGPTNIPDAIYEPANPYYLLLGMPFFPGPGSYFVTLILGFAIIFPLIYKLFDKNPILGLLSCYIIEFCFQIIADFIPYGGLHYLFDGCIIRFLSAIGLGVWFIYGHDIFAKRNLFVILLFPLSIFLTLCSHNAFIGGIFPPSFFENFSFIFERAPLSPAPYNYGLRFFRLYPYWQNVNLFVFFYPALQFLIFMKVLPSKLNKNKKISQKTQKSVRVMSKLTYHILLVQIVYFFIQIPLSTANWDYFMIDDTLFNAILDPIISGVDMNMLTADIYLGLFIAKSFFYFINFVIVVALALSFYLVESGIRKGFKKMGHMMIKNKEDKKFG